MWLQFSVAVFASPTVNGKSDGTNWERGPENSLDPFAKARWLILLSMEARILKYQLGVFKYLP